MLKLKMELYGTACVNLMEVHSGRHGHFHIILFFKKYFGNLKKKSGFAVLDKQKIA